jgi:hypothetical protein
MGSVSCSVEWGMTSYFVTYFVNWLNHMVEEGTFVRETFALQAETVYSGIHSKA